MRHSRMPPSPGWSVTPGHMVFQTLGLVTLFALASGPAIALEEISIDRPDIVDSSDVLLPGQYQVEQGWQINGSGDGLIGQFPASHRIGVARGLELRFETPLVTVANSHLAFDNVAVGAKWHLLDGGGWGQWPACGVSGAVVVHDSLVVEPVVKMLLDTTLPFDTALGVNVGLSAPIAPALPTVLYAASTSHHLIGPIRAYVEISGAYPLATGAVDLGVDVGFNWLLSRDVGIDIALYKGLTAQAQAWYVTTGWAMRFSP